MMDQSGTVLAQNGLATNKVQMGVTTAIAGEGGTPVGSAMIPGFFQQLRDQGLALNWGTYYGCAQARTEVIGECDAMPTSSQLEQMQAHVAEAMHAGAFGVASALIYPPDSFQTTSELAALAKVAAHHGGLYATHVRDEGAKLLEAIDEAIEIGQRASAAVEIFHLKAAEASSWGTLMPKACALIDEARARGVDIAANLYPYRAGGTGLAVTVPNWVFAEGFAAGLERLREPRVRETLKRQVLAGSLPGWSNLVHAAGGWENVVLANACSDSYERFETRSIASIAEELRLDSADVAWDILVAAGADRRPMALFFLMSEADIETALAAPWTSIGSDGAAVAREGEVDALGLPHPRSYGTFPRILAQYVRRRGLLSLPEAIRKMTSWPATRMQLHDRGVIRHGGRADVTVFDLDRIDDRATFEAPTLPPAGITHVLVNGVPVVRDGNHTGARPGHVLLGPGAASVERAC